jgi:hypothetical protein
VSEYRRNAHDGKSFFVIKRVSKSLLEARKQEWIAKVNKDMEQHDDFMLSTVQPSKVREDICKKGYYLFDEGTRSIQLWIDEMIFKDADLEVEIELHGPEQYDAKEEFSQMCCRLLTHNQQVMFKMGWRDSCFKRGKEPEFGASERWCNAVSDMDIFAKYVYRVDPVVRKLHSLLYASNNRRVSTKLSQPIVHLANASAKADSVPTCFSSSNDIVYIFHFPLDDDVPTYGIWEGSVAVTCAMQGAMDMAHHLPPCLQNIRVPMTTIEVGDCGILILDTRTLFARKLLEDSACTIIWTAKGLRPKDISLICDHDAGEEMCKLKNAYHRNFIFPEWPLKDIRPSGKGK